MSSTTFAGADEHPVADFTDEAELFRFVRASRARRHRRTPPARPELGRDDARGHRAVGFPSLRARRAGRYARAGGEAELGDPELRLAVHRHAERLGVLPAVRGVLQVRPSSAGARERAPRVRGRLLVRHALLVASASACTTSASPSPCTTGRGGALCKISISNDDDRAQTAIFTTLVPLGPARLVPVHHRRRRAGHRVLPLEHAADDAKRVLPCSSGIWCTAPWETSSTLLSIACTTSGVCTSLASA